MATLKALIATHPNDALAIGAPGRDWLSYGALRDLSEQVEADLRRFGIVAQDRVAIVLPNGPDMATAFFTLALAATTAPLNPNYKEEEFSFYLEDLNAKALLVEAGYDGPALAAGRKLGLTILRATPQAEAGAFSLGVEGEASSAAPEGAPNEDDVALILHTSGTTSRPKIVPSCRLRLKIGA